MDNLKKLSLISVLVLSSSLTSCRTWAFHEVAGATPIILAEDDDFYYFKSQETYTPIFYYYGLDKDASDYQKFVLDGTNGDYQNDEGNVLVNIQCTARSGDYTGDDPMVLNALELAEYEYYELVILKSADSIYGKINFFSQSGGRSGHMLMLSSYRESFYFTVDKTTKELLNPTSFKGCISAFSPTSFMYLKNESVYLYDIGKSSSVFLFDDEGFDHGMTQYSRTNVYFDTHFAFFEMIHGGFTKETYYLKCASFDGTFVETLDSITYSTIS